jgi:hypothetical protein
MKIIKFIKAHVAGIPKGAVKSVDDKHADKLIKNGYAEDSTEEALEKYNTKMAKLKKESLYADAKANANNSNSDCEGCEGEPEGKKCEECGDEDIIEKVYHILSQEDIDANELAAAGFSVGDEVEMNEEEELVVDEDGKLIGKDLGNV